MIETQCCGDYGLDSPPSFKPKNRRPDGLPFSRWKAPNSGNGFKAMIDGVSRADFIYQIWGIVRPHLSGLVAMLTSGIGRLCVMLIGLALIWFGRKETPKAGTVALNFRSSQMAPNGNAAGRSYPERNFSSTYRTMETNMHLRPAAWIKDQVGLQNGKPPRIVYVLKNDPSGQFAWSSGIGRQNCIFWQMGNDVDRSGFHCASRAVTQSAGEGAGLAPLKCLPKYPAGAAVELRIPA